MYKEVLRKLIIKGAIGFIGGFLFAICSSPEMGILGALMIGFLLAGVPYGWELSGRVVGGWMVIGHIAIMAIAFIIRGVIAVLTGWIAYPIALIYYGIKAKHEA